MSDVNASVTNSISDHEIEFQWIHIAYEESQGFTETYGFSGSQGVVNLEGILIKPAKQPSDTLLIFMHPASTLQLLPVPREAARQGSHVLCAGSRYARNDTAAILEKILLHLGAYIRHAKTQWGYQKTVLVGWSGGGSLALFYQSQAENPTIVATPAGDSLDIIGAGLIPADAVVFQAAHSSRAQLLLESIDPSVQDEQNPDNRITELDIYDFDNPNQPPYSAGYISVYREAQLARMRRITAWVKNTLAELKAAGALELERGFVTHRTFADPRFLDSSLDPSDRKIGWSYLGKPEAVNNGPVGLGRFSTLRSWLSQWSVEDSNADGVANAAHISAPLLVIENSADDAVPQPHTWRVFDAAASPDKHFAVIKGANHYYANQPELLLESTVMIRNWLISNNILTN